nr:MAG TPA: hypothetical protein [Caudoviricetes sp.]
MFFYFFQKSLVIYLFMCYNIYKLRDNKQINERRKVNGCMEVQ